MSEVRVNFTGNTAGLDQSFSRLKTGVGSLKSAMGTLAPAIAGVASVAGAGALVNSLVNMGDEIGKGANRLGIGTTAYQEYGFAARRSGADMNTVETAFKRMSTVIVEGSNKTKDTMLNMGVILEDLAGKKPEEQFEILGKAIAGIKDPTQRSAAAVELFGRAGVMLIPMLKDLDSLKQEAHDFGTIMEDSAVKSAEQFKDSMENLEMSIKSMIANSGLIDWLGKVSQGMDAVNSKKPERLGAIGSGANMGLINNIGENLLGYLGLDETGAQLQINQTAADKKKIMEFGERKQFSFGKTNAEIKADEKAKEAARIADAKDVTEKERAAKKAQDDAEKLAKIESDLRSELEHKIKIQKLINAGKKEEADLAGMVYDYEKRTGKKLEENSDEMSKMRILTASRAELAPEIQKWIDDTVPADTIDITKQQGPEVASNLEKIGAIFGGGMAENKELKGIWENGKSTLKVLEKILDKENNNALGMV